MDITNDILILRNLIPKAVITVESNEDYVKYYCDMRHANISDSEHDGYFAKLKNKFGERLIERYTYATGHFDVFLRNHPNKIHADRACVN